jgi:hypothetical protein
MKGWREMHEKMEVQQVVTTTRELRRAMEEWRWSMWVARCDQQVHRKEGDDTITERERAYAKIKKFWVQHVGGHEKNGQRCVVEVLQMSKEMREQWMQQVNGKGHSTTRVDDHFDVRQSQPRAAPREKTAAVAGEITELQQQQAGGDGVQANEKWGTTGYRDSG